MSGLNDKLLEIKRQKDTYILPENIKKDITVYGITGTLEAGSSGGNIKLFDTVEHMQEDENPQEGDLAVVYRKELADVTAESEFDSCTFPNEVILDEAFTDNIYGRFRAVDSSSGYFDGMVEMSSSSFRFNGYGGSDEIRIEYESEDGITYTRTDGGDVLQEFGVIIKWKDYGEGFNSVIGNFMKIGGNYFDGLYIYNRTKEISQIPLLSINGNDYSGGEYTGELDYLSKDLTSSVYDAISTLETLENINKSSYVILFFNDTLTEFKIYLSQTTGSDRYMGTLYSIIKDGYVCASPYGGYRHSEPFIVKCFTYNLVDKTYTYDDITATSNPDYKIDWTAWYIPHTNEAYISGNIKLSQFSAGDDSNLYIVQADKTSGYTFYFDKYVKYKLKYITASSQLDSTSNYVYEKTFYGKNGVENGILQNGLITNDNIKNVYVELSNMFHNGLVVANGIKFTGLTTTELPFNIDTSNVLDMSQMFSNCTNLTTIPLLNTSNVTNMSQMFSGCSSLTSIPQLDTSNANTTSSMFRGCSSITSIPLLNTSNVTDMGYMFSNCSALTTIPQLDTSNVTIMCEIFRNCKGLTSIPQLNTGNVVNMQGMFQICTGLTTIPLLNTSNVTNMKSMFGGCSGLTSIPLLDTSKVTNMNSMLVGCTNLTSIPQFDTSSVTDMSYMVQNCTGLVTLPALNTSKVTTMNYMFPNCPNLSNESLNNIMQMCINSAITSSSYKTLSIIGLTRTQVQTCTTLSNYNALINAGWTTGY